MHIYIYSIYRVIYTYRQADRQIQTQRETDSHIHVDKQGGKQEKSDGHNEE